MAWTEAGYVLTRFGPAQVTSYEEPNLALLQWPKVDNRPVRQGVLVKNEIFPITGNILTTIANLTYHQDMVPRYLGWGRFVTCDITQDIWEIGIPDQTNQLISLSKQTGRVVISNQPLMDFEDAKTTVIIEIWLDRTAPVKVEQFETIIEALTAFERSESSFGGVSCGILIRLVINFQTPQTGQVLALSLYGDTDRILPLKTNA